MIHAKKRKHVSEQALADSETIAGEPSTAHSSENRGWDRGSSEAAPPPGKRVASKTAAVLPPPDEFEIRFDDNDGDDDGDGDGDSEETTLVANGKAAAQDLPDAEAGESPCRQSQVADTTGDDQGGAGIEVRVQGEAGSADSARWGTAKGDPREEGASLIRLRLLNPASSAAATMHLRPHLQAVKSELLDVLTMTAERTGYNKSVLLVGARGMGKTLVVERALAELQVRFRAAGGGCTVGVVRLQGAVHTDERAAFGEIARQLCAAFGCAFSRTAGVEQNMSFLGNMLRMLHKGHKVVVFVLDDLDMFAAKAKQTVLYYLLDSMQIADTQLALVGTSVRKDVLEMLEKRVRSRFSHQRLLVQEAARQPPHSSDDEPRSSRRAAAAAAPGDAPLAVLASMLRLPEGPATAASPAHTAYAAEFNAAVDAAVAAPVIAEMLAQRCMWVPGEKEVAVPQDLADIALHAVAVMCKRTGLLRTEDVAAGIREQQLLDSSQAQLVSSLSVLEMFVLVAAARLARRREREEGINFEMVWDEYARLGQLRAHADNYCKAAALRAWEQLLACTLLTPVGARGDKKVGLREYQCAHVQVLQEEIREGMRGHPNTPQLLMEWLDKEVMYSTAVV